MSVPASTRVFAPRNCLACDGEVDLYRAHALVPTSRGALPVCSENCLKEAVERAGYASAAAEEDAQEALHPPEAPSSPSASHEKPTLVEVLLQDGALSATAAMTSVGGALALIGSLLSETRTIWLATMFVVAIIAIRTALWIDRLRIRQRSLRRLQEDTFPHAILGASVRLQPIALMVAGLCLVALVEGHFAFGDTLFALGSLICAAPLLYFVESIPRAAAVTASSLLRRGINYPSPAAFYDVGADTRVVITETFFSRAAPPRLLRVHAWGALPKPQLLSIAAKVSEDHPSHQLSQTSAVATAPSDNIRLRRTKFIPGYGFDAVTSDGDRVLVGTRRLLHENGVSIAKASSDVTIAASQGHVMHFIAINDSLEGMLVLVDTPSPGSRAAVHRLMDAHAAVTFVTGRMQPTTKTLGNALDLTDIRADLRTDEQAALVQEFARAGEHVCVIGEPFDAAPLWEHANSAVVLGDARPILPITHNQIGVDGTDPRVAAAAVWLPRQLVWYVKRSSIVTVAIALAVLALSVVGPFWLAPPLLLLLEYLASRRCRRFVQRQLSGLPPIETERVLVGGP